MKYFDQHQEDFRKHVERAFGVLKKRFAFVRNPIKLRIILHNMIVENQRENSVEGLDDDNFESCRPRTDYCRQNRHRITAPFKVLETSIENLPSASLSQRLSRMRETHDTITYYQLQSDLIENLWKFDGNLSMRNYTANSLASLFNFAISIFRLS